MQRQTDDSARFTLKQAEQQWLDLFEPRLCKLYCVALLLTGSAELAEAALLDSLDLLDTANEPDEVYARRILVDAVAKSARAAAQGSAIRVLAIQECAKDAMGASLSAPA